MSATWTARWFIAGQTYSTSAIGIEEQCADLNRKVEAGEWDGREFPAIPRRFVWVLLGSAGAYSDQDHWVVRAYTTEAEANAAVERLTAWHQERAETFRHRYDDGFVAESPADDPSLSSKDWRAEDAEWRVERIALIGGDV